MTAPYSEPASRAKPACIMFLIDQSYSMRDGIGGSQRPKADAVSTAVNKLISELIQICEKGDDKPRHWFDVGMIGYTTDANGVAVVGSAYGGALAGQDLVGIPDLFDNPLDVEVRKRKSQQDDGTGNLITVEEDVNFPIWYRVPPEEQRFGTPTRGAFDYARPVLEQWIAAHPESFPPLVIHLTDGEPTDGDPKETAAVIRDLATSNGNALVVNCHISSSKAEGVLFPTDGEQLPDAFSKDLYEMSSDMPDALRAAAEVKQVSAPVGCKMMAFNADSVNLLKLLSVGTAAGPANIAERAAHLR